MLRNVYVAFQTLIPNGAFAALEPLIKALAPGLLLAGLFFSSCHTTRCTREYFETGHPSLIVCYNKAHQRDGTYLEYYENGHPLYEGTYVADSLNGNLTRYHQNGILYYKFEYRMNKLWNVLGMQDTTGAALNSGDLKNGNGQLRFYDDLGVLDSYGMYENGLKEGYWKLVSNAGAQDSVLYVHGHRNGNGRLEIIY